MKIYKKGSKIKLWWSTHDYDSAVSEIITLETDYTEQALYDLAWEYMMNDKEPEAWFEEVEDENM